MMHVQEREREGERKLAILNMFCPTGASDQNKTRN